MDFTELIENKGIGIFDILDEENKLPKPSYDHFTSEVHKKNKNHYRIAVSTTNWNVYPANMRHIDPMLNVWPASVTMDYWLNVSYFEQPARHQVFVNSFIHTQNTISDIALPVEFPHCELCVVNKVLQVIQQYSWIFFFRWQRWDFDSVYIWLKCTLGECLCLLGWHITHWP